MSSQKMSGLEIIRQIALVVMFLLLLFSLYLTLDNRDHEALYLIACVSIFLLLRMYRNWGITRKEIGELNERLDKLQKL